MKNVELTDACFQGAVSLERSDGWVQPWRILYQQKDLFPPNGMKGDRAAGVRIGFTSDTRHVSITFVAREHRFKVDCLVDGKLFQRVEVAGEEQIVFAVLAAGMKRIELYLPPDCSMQIKSLMIDEKAVFMPLAMSEKRWITYGSSITQCVGAAGPSETWPAIAARRLGWHLTCLGYGGNCHIQPMIARMIRDLPADYISLCLGINVYEQSSLGERSLQAAVIGMVQIIRERHPDTPVVVMSPIISPRMEASVNKAGFTLIQLRAEIREAVHRLQNSDDPYIRYQNGLGLLGEAEAVYLPDGLHPNAEGYRIMAERFIEQIAPVLMTMGSL